MLLSKDLRGFPPYAGCIFSDLKLSYGVEHLEPGLPVEVLHSSQHTAFDMNAKPVVHPGFQKEISVLLVDDQPSVRVGLRMLLQLEAYVRVIGEAGTGTEAVTLAQALNPDLVIMDVEMPGLDGITATQRCIDIWPHCVIIILTIHSRPEVRERAMAAGASAFVEKGKPQDLRDAFRQALLKLNTSPEI